jgi:hypothetical protein
MNRRYALWGRSAKLGVALLMAALTVVGVQTVHAQTDKPEIPTLSLTGRAAGWNDTYYPDGRIWVPRSGNNGQRELLVPVFIKNCWRTTSTYEAFPIYSFKFKMQFDSTALQYMGIEKNGPARGPQGTPLSCLAKDFEFSSDVTRDVNYQSVINAPQANRLRGKRVLVTGISAKPLPQTGDPNTPCDQRPFVELCYVRFKVVANPASDPVSALTPIILTNDTLFYNDFQVGKELAFPGDPAPAVYSGLGGVDNYYIDINGDTLNRDAPRFSRPGMIWMHVTDEIPRISFTNVADRRFRLVDSVDDSNNSNWYVVDPITIDSGSTFENVAGGLGTRDINVINAVPGSRMTDVLVQSDQDWLFFTSFTQGGQGEVNPFPQPVREGVIPVLDKGILGTILGQTPFADPTVLQRDMNLRIICDPFKLPLGSGGELAGIYTGYLSFKSKSMDVSPVRVKVTFIYFRAPFEPRRFDEDGNWQTGNPDSPARGILLEVRNSNNPIERTWLAMGVGARATDNADLLFGEEPYEAPLNGFGARWYPMDSTGQDIYQYGLNDLWAKTQQGPKASSRDIRNIYADTTLIYKCRFNAGSALNYPIVVSWDTDDFTENGEYFIRDTVNGSRFNVNMRQATNVGGTRYSYTIQDADINAFIIEYTLPKVAQFPVIKKGWNLLSLPVNPSSAFYKNVFKKSVNIPVLFTQNSYQQEEALRPGIGYFIKYADEDVDRTVAGSRIYRINDENFPVNLYDGWNTIGSLSRPTNVESVSLIPVNSGVFPTIEGDIYGYVTDRGYQAVSEIVPGLGYWIKIKGRAQLDMSLSKATGIDFRAVRSSVIASATKLGVRDNEGKNSDLYIVENGTLAARNFFELPPLPPNGLFDVRFGTNQYVDDATNPMVRLQGATFPVELTVNNPNRSYTVSNAITGEVLGTINAGINNSVVITDRTATAIRLAAVDAAVAGVNVMPNPVASNGTLEYTVAEAGNVSIVLYSAVGEEISTLVNETKLVGTYGIDLNTSTLAPGRYIVKMTNGANVLTSSVTVVR